MAQPTMQDAYDEALRQLGEMHVIQALAGKAQAAEIERLTAERDDPLHRADHAPQES